MTYSRVDMPLSPSPEGGTGHAGTDVLLRDTARCFRRHKNWLLCTMLATQLDVVIERGEIKT